MNVISYAQRREKFLGLAAQAYDELETCYDQHPDERSVRRAGV